MKKRILLLLAIAVIAIGLFVACDGGTPGVGPHTHTLVHHPMVEPQCHTAGNVEYWSCSMCDERFADESAESEAGDILIDTVDCVYVDCICQWCGGNNHELTHTAGTPARCNQTGVLEHWTCSACEKVYTDAEGKNETESTVAEKVPCVYVDGLCKWCGWNADGYVRCNQDGTANASGDYILFGEYPQTIKAADVTVTDEKDSRGYYLGSDGAYYAAVKAGPKEDKYRFSDDTKIVKDTVYYFKVEPIRWRILSMEDGKALLVCDSIIDCQVYTSFSDSLKLDRTNDYENSTIRRWLAETFYEKVFGELQKSLIETTAVDNSAKTTGSYWYQYPYKSTTDKVYLLSYQDVTNKDYGFTSYESRQMQASDYSRARGVYMNTTEKYYACGGWWLRSPCSVNEDVAVSTVNYDGDYKYYGAAGATQVGLVPALTLRLS